MGDSRGRWEGTTLVVDVTNLTDKTWVTGEQGGEGMSTGSFHSPAMQVVERFIIVDADHIDYESVIEDHPNGIPAAARSDPILRLIQDAPDG